MSDQTQAGGAGPEITVTKQTGMFISLMFISIVLLLIFIATRLNLSANVSRTDSQDDEKSSDVSEKVGWFLYFGIA